MNHSKTLMTLGCTVGLLFPITAQAEMSYLQGIKPDAPIREFAIPRIPFTFIYFVDGERIIITRLLDNRADRPEELR